MGKESRTQALLNEYKGYLFEFFVGHELAKTFNLTSDFHLSLSSSYLQMLSTQEAYLRNHHPDFLEKIKNLSLQFVKEWQLSSTFPTEIKKVILCGKESFQTQNEVDLILFDASNRQIGMSLKLIKSGGSVNTKSAGVKSFISKYFSSIPGANQHQEEFNQEFEVLKNELYQQLASELNTPVDQLRATWQTMGLSVLPGELPAIYRSHFLSFLSSVAEAIFFRCEKMQIDQYPPAEIFAPLLGFSTLDESFLQLQVEYENDYQFKSYTYQSLKELMETLSCVKLEKGSKTSKATIRLKDRTLILRPKAMNDLFTGGFKINIQVKKIDNKKNKNRQNNRKNINPLFSTKEQPQAPFSL